MWVDFFKYLVVNSLMNFFSKISLLEIPILIHFIDFYYVQRKNGIEYNQIDLMTNALMNMNINRHSISLFRT